MEEIATQDYESIAGGWIQYIVFGYEYLGMLQAAEEFGSGLGSGLYDGLHPGWNKP